MTDILPVSVAPVEVFPGGYRIPGVDRVITAEAAQHAKSKGALRFSPKWRLLALGFCAERDAATSDRPGQSLPAETDGAVTPSGQAPGSAASPKSLIPDPGAPNSRSAVAVGAADRANTLQNGAVA